MQPATIEHVIPGRVRLRFPGQRGNTAFFEQIVTLVSQHPAVEEARANPLTGSLLVRHSGSLDELARAAADMGLISADALAGIRAQLTPEQRGWLALSPLQGPQIPAIALTGLGALQVLRGRLLGPASEHFWHARELWRRGMPQAALGLGFLGLLQLSRANLFGSATSLIVYALLLQESGRTSQARTIAPERQRLT